MRYIPLTLLVLGLLLLPVAAWAQPHPETAAEQFSRALREHQSHQYEASTRAFRAFLDQHPHHAAAADALFMEAQGTLALGRPEHASRLFAEFERTYPAHPLAWEARTGIARFFFESERYTEADAVLSALIGSAPPDAVAARAYFWRAETRFALGQEPEGMNDLLAIPDQFPDVAVAPSALYLAGYQHVKMNRLEAAADVFRRLERQYPSANFVRELGLAYAEIYYELADYPQLIGFVEPRLRTLTGTALERARYLLAEAYLHTGRLQEADRLFRLVLVEHAGGPHYRNALLGAGRTLFLLNEHPRAIQMLTLAAADHRDALTGEALLRRAQSHLALNQRAEARATLDEVIAGWPRSTFEEFALIEAGVLSYRQQDWDVATGYFDQLLTHFPETAFIDEALNLNANARLAAGDGPRADALFERAIARTGADPAVREPLEFQRAFRLYSAGAYREALATFQRLSDSAVSPDIKADALFWRAESHYQLDQLNEALRGVGQYLRENPDGQFYSAAQYIRAYALFRQARYNEAAIAFEAFLDDFSPRDVLPGGPNYNADAHLRLGDSYFALRRYLEAVNAYVRVRGQDEDYALYQAAQAYFFAGQPDRGRRTLARIEREHPNSTFREEAAFNIGYFLFQEGETDQAIETFRAFMRQFPRGALAPRALYTMGDVYYNADRLQEAAATYREVMQRFPRSPFAASAALSLQDAMIGLGDEDAGRRELETFARTAPPEVSIDVRLRTIESDIQRGDYANADRSLAELLRGSLTDEQRSAAQYFRGMLAEANNRVAEAYAAYTQVADGGPSPRRSDAARRLALLAVQQGDLQRAVLAYSSLERSSTRPEVQAEARLGRARALLMQGQAATARTVLQEFQSTFTANDLPEYHVLMGRALEALEQIPQAQQAYTEARTSAQGGIAAEALVRLSALHVQQGQWSEALTLLAELDALALSYPEAHAEGLVWRARAELASGDAARARETFLLVEGQYANSPWARVASRERQTL